ncbi:hypothetical protein NQ315_004504 [Exocentrus adspersus]|uniref:DNA mismatch repair proteins mutS family domain-containing protein n=1 Tax=Exocentrus adspersus TaxID=1586481 RepID=A0AAV8VPW7_9CUCU|nr:hypothetical protein NQ315_004504 [Exocentrus adspersus]
MSSEEDTRIIVALTEGRGEARCEVGIAVINVSKPLLVLCQISDTQSYINTLTKINIFNPQEILVPITFVEKFTGNRLIDIVKERFPRIKYTGCARIARIHLRYYALAAASALITYVYDNLYVYYAAGSIKIDYQESEGYAIIDVSTADRLELVCSAKPAQGNKYSSLFGILNHCVTKIGCRTLRSSILQPPCRVQYIEERLNAVTELIRHPEMLVSIQTLLQKVTNIEQLLSITTLLPDDPQKCSNRQLNYILLLNSLLDLIIPLKEVLSKSKHHFFVQLTKTLSSEEFSSIKNIVRNTIQENAYPAKGQAAVMQRCFAIKPGINGLLDLVRKTYSERLDDMREYVKRLAEKYDLTLTLGNNQTKGHHIVLNLNQKQKRYMKKSDLPDEFIEVYRLAGSFTMKTPEIVNLSTRLEDIMADILRISNVMVHSILVEIKKYISLFYKLCEEIAHLDVLQSLAECSVRNGYVRPTFGDFTEITFAHHPLLDFLLPTKPISNPIRCSSDYNVHIITGPNGSGKSIFIRQVLLLQIMAQVGCYIPAQTAILRPADRMYARIYLEDNMEHGASSFILEFYKTSLASDVVAQRAVIEKQLRTSSVNQLSYFCNSLCFTIRKDRYFSPDLMKEIKYIMTTMTNNSVVIIDELCRSTSLEEGTALAIAIVEKLAQSSAFIYITTHFTLLTKLYDMYLNVKLWQLETIPSGEDPKTFKLDFRHNLIPGVTSVKRYGVYIVRNIWPDRILKYVDDLLDTMAKKPTSPNIVTLDEKIRLKYSIESQLRKLKSQRKLTVAAINKLLNQYHSELEKLDFHTNVIPLPERESIVGPQDIPIIGHSIFGDIRDNYSIEDDLQATDARLKENFTPQPSLSSQLSSANLEIQRAQNRMKEIFTPEMSQQSEYANYLDQNCPNAEFYDNYRNKSNPNVMYNQGQNEYIMQNYSDGNRFQTYNDNDMSECYQNVSRFIAENSENIYKLIPEVNLSYEGISHFSQNTFNVNQQAFCDPQNVLRKPPNIPESTNSKPSSIEVSKDMDDFQFSLPLQNNANKTSTPIINRGNALSRSGSTVVQIYNNKHDFSTSSNDQNCSSKKNNSIVVTSKGVELEDLDFQSIQEELEICSKIMDEDGDFEGSVNTTYKILPDCYQKEEEKNQGQTPKIKHQHIIPIVTVIEGPNNTTLSFNDDESEDIPKHNEIKEYKSPQTKINIISNIVIPRRIETENLGLQENENRLDFQDTLSMDHDSCINKEQTNHSMVEEYKSQMSLEDPKLGNLELLNGSDVINCFQETYKSFDSAYDPKYLSGNGSVNDSFKSIIENNHEYSLNYSCKDQFSKTMTVEERVSIPKDDNNCVTSASGYEITLIDNPKKFVESLVMDKEVEVGKIRTLDASNSRVENVEDNTNLNFEEINNNKQEKSNSTNIDKTVLTSVSYASRLRQLDQTYSSPQEGDTTNKTSQDKTITSISSASRKRNLDQVTTDSTSDSGGKSKETSSSLKESDEDKSKSNLRPRDDSTLATSTKTNNKKPTQKKKSKKHAMNQKFIPPRKLSAKEIREDFKEQDRKILEGTPSSSEFSKYLEQLIKRPTVKQIRNTVHLAKVRKTNEGVEVIPAKPRMNKKLKPSTSMKTHYSNENFSVSIFSDKNALPFESYLNSNEKDYKTFSFNFQKNQEAEQKLGFEPTTLSFGEYTNNSVTKRFVRTISETLCSGQSGNSFRMKHVLEPNQDIGSVYMSQQSTINQTLTPDGFYKQNKDDISRILKKYLGGTHTQEDISSSANSQRKRSIFETDDIDGIDLNI